MSSSSASVAPPAGRTLEDRLNPILVKEVRQSLRGRYFRALFWLTLGSATLIGLSVVAEASSRRAIDGVGQSFFLIMFGCLSAAVLGFAPFSAFLATAAEWDENTHDLLVLSNLRPRQIVTGKLLSALIQALLYYSTFGPFLAFAFLLNGVDPLVIAVLIGGSMATCVALSLTGIALASLSRVKALRVVLMALFGMGLVMVWGMSMGVATGLTEQPESLREPMAIPAAVSFSLAALLVGSVFGVIASSRLAHPEENQSTGMRILSTVLVVVAAAWGAWMSAESGEHEFLWAAQLIAILPLALMWLFFLSEPAQLGRRVAKHVASSPLAALASAPFLPGGGRGAALMLFHTVVALGGTALGWIAGADSTEVLQSFAVVLGVYVYAWLYIALPTLIGSPFVHTARGQTVLRVTALALLPLFLLGPALLGLLLGITSLMKIDHPLNPVWAIERFDGITSLSDFAFFVFCAVLCAVVLAQSVRITRGVLEVVRASRARREAALR